MTQNTQSKNKKLDYNKMRKFSSLKESNKKINGQATDWKKIFSKHRVDERLKEYVKNLENTI